MQNLRVTLIQCELHWHDAEANREQFEQLFAGLQGNTDLIILPEMFTTGFTMEPEALAEPADGETVQWMLAQAAKLDAAIVGSTMVKVGAGYRNRMVFATPEGELHHYDKRHLFRMGGEHNHYEAGAERVIVNYRGWRIMPQICYDLRFPVFCRNRNDYDLLIYVANWPKPRRNPWRTLLQARALENQCYVAGVNRIGTDGKGLEYSGDSLMVDFTGEIAIDGGTEELLVATRTLDRSALDTFRDNFPAWMDADRFDLKL